MDGLLDKRKYYKGMTRQEILSEALKDFNYASSYWRPFYQRFSKDVEFSLMGKQWENWVSAELKDNKRRIAQVTMNHTKPFIMRTVNRIVTQRRRAKVQPAHKGSEKKAELLDSILRAYQSTDSYITAFNKAALYMVTAGMGYFRIITDYLDTEDVANYDQDISIVPVFDPTLIFFSSTGVEQDFSDRSYCFALNRLTKEHFNSLYPDCDFNENNGFDSGGLWADPWNGGEETITVAEYFKIYEERVKGYRLWDGTIVNDLIDKNGEKIPEEAIAKKLPDRIKKNLVYRMITQNNILEEVEMGDLPIPIIPVAGLDFSLYGKMHFTGMTQDVKDANRLRNYAMGSLMEQMHTGAKGLKFIATKDQVSGNRDDWSNLTRYDTPLLTYNPVPVTMPDTGQSFMPPAPQLINTTPQLTGNMQVAEFLGTEHNAILGIFGAAMGKSDYSGQSGKAIGNLRMESDLTMQHFSESMARACTRVGQVALKYYKVVVDTPREQRAILGDGKVKRVKVNNGNGDDAGEFLDLTTGKYEVVIEDSNYFATNAEEKVSTTLEVMKVIPRLGEVAPDKLLEYMGHHDLADRAKYLLPPDLRARENEDEDAKIDPQLLAQQLEKTIQALKTVSEQRDVLVKKIDEDNYDKDIELQKIQLEERSINEQSRIKIYEIDSKKQIEIMKMEHDSKVNHYNRVTDINQTILSNEMKENEEKDSK